MMRTTFQKKENRDEKKARENHATGFFD